MRRLQNVYNFTLSTHTRLDAHKEELLLTTFRPQNNSQESRDSTYHEDHKELSPRKYQTLTRPSPRFGLTTKVQDLLHPQQMNKSIFFLKTQPN